jgi:1,4-alpha-glucan branching enzyme
VFNTDRPEFGGSGWNFNGTVKCERVASHGKEASIAVKLPPYGAVYFRGSGKLPAPKPPKAEKKTKETKNAKDTKKSTAAAKSAKTEPKKRASGRPRKTKE